MTVNCTVHVSDTGIYMEYIDDPRWQNHEEGHIEQGFSTWRLPLYGGAAIVGFLWELLPGTEPSKGNNPRGTSTILTKWMPRSTRIGRKGARRCVWPATPFVWQELSGA